jgi:hypothetical protein
MTDNVNPEREQRQEEFRQSLSIPGKFDAPDNMAFFEPGEMEWLVTESGKSNDEILAYMHKRCDDAEAERAKFRNVLG